MITLNAFADYYYIFLILYQAWDNMYPHYLFPCLSFGGLRCTAPQSRGQMGYTAAGFRLCCTHSLVAAASGGGKHFLLRADAGGRTCERPRGRGAASALGRPGRDLAAARALRLLSPSQAVKWRLLPTSERKLP